jgi:hypothetical protein
MRRLLTASALLILLGATPGMARPYPWCARTPLNGGSLECRYVTLQQCQATVYGLGGDCLQNPVIAFSQRPGPSPDPGWQGAAWPDDGSNHGRHKKRQ